MIRLLRALLRVGLVSYIAPLLRIVSLTKSVLCSGAPRWSVPGESLCRGRASQGEAVAPLLTGVLGRFFAIAAYEEFVELGHFGAVGLRLLFELTREEVRRFPLLRPPGGWTSDAVWDVVHGFYVDRGPRVTVMLLAQAGDDASMARLLRRSLRNYLIDQVRKTDLGALRRRLEELLDGDPAVERVPTGEPGAGRWQLAGMAGVPWGGRIEELVATAYAVSGVRLVRWSSDARRSPIAERESLRAVAQAVLAAAGGSLEIGQLVAVFARRFPATIELGDVPMSPEVEAVASAPVEDLPEVQVLVAERAREVYDQLTPRERAMTPPTQQITRGGFGVCDRDAVTDHHAFGADEHLLDEQAQHPLALGDQGGRGGVAQPAEEALQVVGELEGGLLVCELGLERVELGGQGVLLGAQGGHAAA